MTRTGDAKPRLEAFLAERRAGGDAAPGLEEVTLAGHRRAQLAEYRRRRAASDAAEADGHDDADALAPAPPPAANWTSIGPIAVLEGQAETLPTVSGRVSALAVAGDGRRVYVGAANGGIWRSLDGGFQWEAMSDEFDLNPEHHVVDSLATGAVALVEGTGAADDRLYVGTGEGWTSGEYGGVGPLRSDDGGRTWNREPVQNAAGGASDLDGVGFFELAVDPADREHAVGATQRGLYRRIPDGAGGFVWRLVHAGECSSVVVTRGGGVTRFFALQRGGRARTWDSSQGSLDAWTNPAPTQSLPGLDQPAAPPPPAIHRGVLGVSGGHPATLYAMLANGDGSTHLHGVFRLDLGDATPGWRRVDGVPDDVLGPEGKAQGFYDQAIAVDPSDANTFYVGGKGTGAYAALYRCEVTTSGAGATRSHTARPTLLGQSVHPDVHVLVFRPGSSRELWVGCDGGLFVAMDARRSGREVFAARNSGLATLTLMGLAHHPHDPTFLFAGLQDNGGIRYRGDEVWQHRLAGDGGATVVDWAVPAAGSTPPVAQRRLRFLNGYVRGSIRRATADADRYRSRDVDVPLGSRPNPDPTKTERVAESVLFYPPIDGVPPDGDPTHASRVAFGSERPWVSDDFGDRWRSVPNNKLDADASGPGDVLQVGGTNQVIRSLCWAGFQRLYIGTTAGHLFRIHDDPTSGWQPAEHLGRPAGARPLTSITVDPRPGDDSAVWLTFGGHATAQHVWRYDHSQPAASRFTARSTGLLDTQHNALVVDPANPEHLYVGADIGVWRSVDAGATWTEFSPGLPDAAVLDLDLHPTTRLLRATTHGRGVWELAIDRAAHPGVELFVRANRADTGRTAAPTAGFHVTDVERVLAVDQSPDILVDAPDRRGAYRLSAAVDDPVRFVAGRDSDGPLLTAAAGAEAITHVFVQVHGLGVTRASAVRVTLLLALADGTPPALPADYDDALRAGTPIAGDGWRTVGTATVAGVRAGSPRIARFDVSSTSLPAPGDVGGRRAHLLALVHHADDAWTSTERNPTELSRTERRAALRTVALDRASGGAAQPVAGAAGAAAGAGIPAVAPDGGPIGVSSLAPVAVALLARKRLSDAVDGIRRKVHSDRVDAGFGGFLGTVAPTETERKVLALVELARDLFDSGPTAPVGEDHPAAGLGAYTLLGALGFEVPGYAGLLRPGGAWVSDVIRRGTPDPHRSAVRVPAASFAVAAGRLGLDRAPDDDAKERIRAFTAGLLASTASGVLVAPQLRDLLGRETHADWERWLPSAGARAVDAAIRERLLRDGPTADWWPPVGGVPTALWEGFRVALGQAYQLPGSRRRGFAPFEAAFEPGEWLTTQRLANAYAVFRDSWGSSAWHWTAYWGLLSPVLLGPSMAMLIGRALPQAGAFFDPGRSVDERAVFELLTTGVAWGAVPPFVYSMLLWSQVDEHTEPFVNALVLFVLRAALSIAGFATASDQDVGDVARWLGVATPLLATDVYAAVRAAVGAGASRPGTAAVFGLQTIPALTGLTTLGVSAVLKAADIEDGAGFWVTWGLFTAAMLGAGIPIAVALADGGGWQSWFLRSDRRFPVLDALDRARRDHVEPRALARVFDDSTLWADPGPELHQHSLPSGARAVVRLWWTGAGTLDISHDADRIVLRPSEAGEQVVVVPPAGVTSAELAAMFEPVLAGVEAEPVEAADPQYRLPWPQTVADPGDLGPIADHAAGASSFVRVGTGREDAYLLRHAPRFELTTAAGLEGPARSGVDAFPVVPQGGLGDLEATGLGQAADLAVLLAMAAVPTLEGGVVTVNDGLDPLPDDTVEEVYQVFRHWNLDERRLHDWRMLVSGGADDEKPAGDDPMIPAPTGYVSAHGDGGRLAAAMGWLPLWRAWLRVASDPGANGDADVALAGTPVITAPDGTRRRPTNAELSAGVRFLFDLR